MILVAHGGRFRVILYLMAAGTYSMCRRLKQSSAGENPATK